MPPIKLVNSDTIVAAQVVKNLGTNAKRIMINREPALGAIIKASQQVSDISVERAIEWAVMVTYGTMQSAALRTVNNVVPLPSVN